MKVALFGDVGGHYVPFVAGLERLGVDMNTLTIPVGLIIVQVGDLVHRGPQSDEVVAVVDAIMRRNPQQWIQLFGNHEAMHLDGTLKFFHCPCSLETIATIKEWWQNKRAHVAAYMAHQPTTQLPLPHTLITHAGVVFPLASTVSNSPMTAESVGAGLNQKQPGSIRILDTAGAILGVQDRMVGPWWAAAGQEVDPSWAEEEMPFNQIHGHTLLFDWDRRKWFPSTPQRLRNAMLDPTVRSTTIAPRSPNSGSLVGIDPGYGVQQTQNYMRHLLVDNVTNINSR